MAVLESRVDQSFREHAMLTSEIKALKDSVVAINDSNIKLSVYVKALWPALSLTLTVVGFLVGKFIF